MGKRSRRKGQAADGAANGKAQARAAEAPPQPDAAPAEAAADGAGGTKAARDRAGAGAEAGAARPPGGQQAETTEGGATAAGEQPQQRRTLADPRLREVIAYAEEADMLYHLYRWVLLKGSVPTARDWLPREDMPHPDAVAEVFGSWQRFLDHAQLADSPLLARLRALEDQQKELEGRERQVEREEQRAADLRRQLDVARRRREEAERERDEAVARAARAERALADAETRAARAEERLAERRAAAAESAAERRQEVSEEWLAAHEAALAELEAIRGHRDELLRRVEELEEAVARDRQAIAELSAALGDRQAGEAAGEDAAGGDGETPDEEPRSVLEAVRIAAASCRHLVFTESAFESAADSPYRRPQEILDALRKLDQLAERYAAGQMGVSLGQAAQELGLTWRAGVSELARTRWAKHYVTNHDGHTLELGPHLAIGSGSGAGFVARIYLHVADGNGPVPRGIYVGHVGRHLPDTTT
jgi:hypothetical protein